MPIHFLLGPAGSGKTRRCLAGVQEELLRAPVGPNLVFLAPKQATYQIERQLLEDPRLPGWSRLQILSFDRLSRQILESTRPVELLAEEGRLMVLRALLRRLAPQLRVFHAAARLAGFAQELSTVLRELRNHHLGSHRLLDLASHLAVSAPLAHKLHDLSLLLHAYQSWLTDHGVEDADTLPDLATRALLDRSFPFHLGGLWLDGFAEMTPQELDLLAAVVQRSDHATIAFCIDHQPSEDAPWLSTWSVVSQTFRRCHTRLAALPGPAPTVRLLPESGAPTRFSRVSESAPESAPLGTLARLASRWTRPQPSEPTSPPALPDPAVRLGPCPNREGEAVLAAREILSHVRAGGRFREIGVLVRSLEPFQATLERVFSRYGIPFFLDCRESLAHHPLAELTRAALRLAAHGWTHEDWFGALKTDLTPLPTHRVHSLENEALARGWTPSVWRALAGSTHRDPGLDATAAVVGPTASAFARFIDTLGPTPDANALSRTLQSLWEDLGVRSTLESWVAESESRPGIPRAPHLSAWEQLQAWLENLERGFGGESLPLADWLPILDSGLSSLTAGLIPSSLDQVLVGAIDRSRQPDLRLALVLGLNEGIFPAAPAHGGMLTNHDREQLAAAGATLGPDRRRRVGHERYFGYIAVTRSRQRLVLTWSERNEDGKALNPSPFIRHIQSLLPSLPLEGGNAEPIPLETPASQLAERVLHSSELLPWLLARETVPGLDDLAGDDLRRDWLRQARLRPKHQTLARSLVLALHGGEPEVSVSALESLGSCPFQFFVRHTLRGTERERFETDVRRLGSLAHELLAAFLDETRSRNLPWGKLADDEATRLFSGLVTRILEQPDHALFTATPEARWQTDALVRALQGAVGQFVVWAAHCRFEPRAAELAFGGNAGLPAWRIDLGSNLSLRIRGKVDRVDLLTDPSGSARFLVCDYKMRRPSFVDALVAAGIDLQLTAYTLALAEFPSWLGMPEAGNQPPEPAGLFYIGLRGRPSPPRTREGAPSPEEARPGLHLHRGRFRESALADLDLRTGERSRGQFAIDLNRDGSLRKGGDGRPDPEFRALLDTARETIRRLGRDLHAGVADVAPFARGSRLACDRCELAEVCRFDAWTQTYRKVG